MELLKNTLFINLDDRKDRLEHAINEFNKTNINAERVSGIKLQSGALGCTLSHIKCIEIAIERDYDYVFICEDDITFLNPDLFKEKLSLFHGNNNINWDVLVIGGNTLPPYEKITDYCIRVFHSQTTTGYIVKKHYYKTLLTNFKESAKQLIQNPENKLDNALDRYWLKLQKQDKFCMLIPPTVIQYDSYSDIENTNVSYEHLMLDMNKEYLFAKR